MQSFGAVEALDLVSHLHVGSLAGAVGEPTVVDSVAFEIDVVETDGAVAVGC